MVKKLLVSFLALGMFVALPASAARLESGESYNLPTGKSVNEDLYVGAGMVEVAGNVTGDLIAAGGNLNVTGDVSQDGALAGGTVNVMGSFGDDLRVAGGNILIGGNVAGDLIVMAGSVKVLPGVTIGGDVILGGGALSFDGTAAGDLIANGGDIQINGTVRGNAEISTSGSLALGEGSSIQGNLTYAAPSQALLKEGAKVVGSLDFTKAKRPSLAKKQREARDGKTAMAAVFGILTAAWLIKLVAMLVVAMLAVYIWKKKSLVIVNEAKDKFGWSLLRGLVVMVVTPIAVIILLFTMIGSLLGVIGGAAFVLLVLLAKVYAAVFLGAWLFWIFTRKKKGAKLRVDWLTALVGVVALSIIGLIPIVGWIISALLFLTALGSICKLSRKACITHEKGK